MGVSSSVVEQLQNNQSMVNLVGKGISVISNEIPERFSVQSLNLSHNKIVQLPPKLPGLRAISLAYNGYRVIPKQVELSIMNYTDLINLDLSNNFLSVVPKAFISHPSLNELNLFGNSFVKLDFSSLPIVYLNVGRNKLQHITNLNPKTEILSAELNMITELPPPSPTLTRLFLSMNRITSLTDTVTFDNLTILDLSRNQISSMPPSLKEIFPNLVVLDISYNLIEKVPSLPSKIYEISINNNKISNLPKLNTYLHLSIIDCSYNNIRKVSALPRKIQTFIADNNKISSMDECETKKLSKFSINQNKLTSLPSHMGNKLKKYVIRGNLIQNIKLDVFHHKLAHIDLSDNQIEELPKGLFLSSCLKTLILAHNKIVALPDGIEESILLDLNLSYNPLKSFPSVLPKNLERLIISHCSLGMLPKSIEQLEELVELDISNNYISNLPHFDNLLKFYASKNRFTVMPTLCDVIEEVDLSFNRMMQFTENNAPFHQDSLIRIDVSFNQITHIPKLQCKSLQFLAINKNPIKEEIDFKDVPSIEVLHIMQQTSAVNLKEGCEVYSSNRTLSQNFSFMHTLDNTYIYSQTFGTGLLLHEDIILAKSKVLETGRILGYVLATKDPSVSITFSNTLLERLSKYKTFNDKFIIKSLEKAEKAVESQATMLVPSQTAFIIYDKTTLYYAGYTQVPIFILNKNRELRSVNDSRWPRKMLDKTINYLVYRTLPVPTVGKIDLQPNDTYIIITNVNLCETLGKSIFTEICNTAKDSRELLFTLRNVGRSMNKFDNLTVIIFDISQFQESST